MYEAFQERIADIDRRMATIVCQGFDDCCGVESIFKVRNKSFCFTNIYKLFFFYEIKDEYSNYIS